MSHNLIKSVLVATSLSFSSFMMAICLSANATQELQTVQNAPVLIASGTWAKKSFDSAGTWTIYQDENGTFVKLSDDFKTKSAPDLKIFFSPLAAADANGKNATQGSVLIAPLSSNRGEQIYKIPSTINVSDYQSILIHCEAYSKLWSAADL